MDKNIYSSYEEIERELEILKIKKQLNLQKIILEVEKTKESISTINIVKSFLGDYKSIFSNYSGTILNIAIPLLINWFTKRKRGN